MAKETKTEKKQTATSKKSFVGVVISDKSDKTITIKTERQVAHPLYKKYYKQSRKLIAHDEKNEAGEGDTVRIVEIRPLSKTKRWNLVEVLEKAK